jgi:hypothetical protein
MLAGYAIGKHGMDFLLPGVAVKGISKGMKAVRGVSGASRSLKTAGQALIPANGLENRATFEVYKATLRAQMEKPYVVDLKLRDYIETNYKPGSSIGSGSTAAAIRHELASGERVREKFHSQKGRDMIICLEKWLKNNPMETPGDRATYENIIKDLRNVLEE